MAQAFGWRGSHEPRAHSKGSSAVYLFLLLACTTILFCTVIAAAMVLALATLANLE